VLATTSLGRQDPRLFDEAFDWLASFGSLNNLQRLANLHRIHPLSDSRVLIAIADWLVKKAYQPRWKAIEKESRSEMKCVWRRYFTAPKVRFLKFQTKSSKPAVLREACSNHVD
jgi:hypothetical protein